MPSGRRQAARWKIPSEEVNRKIVRTLQVDRIFTGLAVGPETSSRPAQNLDKSTGGGVDSDTRKLRSLLGQTTGSGDTVTRTSQREGCITMATEKIGSRVQFPARQYSQPMHCEGVALSPSNNGDILNNWRPALDGALRLANHNSERIGADGGSPRTERYNGKKRVKIPTGIEP